MVKKSELKKYCKRCHKKVKSSSKLAEGYTATAKDNLRFANQAIKISHEALTEFYME